VISDFSLSIAHTLQLPRTP